MRRKKSSCIFFLIGLLLFSCREKEKKVVVAPRITLQSTLPKMEQSKALLSDGCIVLRAGNDVISSMFAQLNRTDKTFSHCGIAFEEDKKWYVFHSIGGEDNPNSKLRKDTYEKFVGFEHNLGFGICNYALTDTQLQKLHNIVLNYYQKEIPFDMQFDLHSNDRLYCAEMVYKAYQQALGVDTFFSTTVIKDFKYVSTDNLFVNKHAHLLCHVNYCD